MCSRSRRLIGGTVGGYITYAGAHRLLDVGVRGAAQVARDFPRVGARACSLTGLMRVLLFLAVLGVVSGGVVARPGQPRGFRVRGSRGGEVGLRLFGVILWAAAITSVIGASYTSVSFLVAGHARLERHRSMLVVGFIVARRRSVFLAAGAAPVPLLIFAGAFNGLILPIGVAVVLWVAWRRRDLLGGYAYPGGLAPSARPPGWSPSTSDGSRSADLARCSSSVVRAAPPAAAHDLLRVRRVELGPRR